VNRGSAGFGWFGRVWFIEKHGFCQRKFGAVKNRAFCKIDLFRFLLWKMKMTIKENFLLLCLLLVACSQALASQVIPKASVFVEGDEEANKNCMFSYSSAEAAAKAALRYNRIEIEDRKFSESIEIYVGAGSFTEVAGRSSCAVALTVEFQQYQSVKMPISNRDIASRVVHCRNGVGGILPKNIVQESMNSAVKRIIDECISEIEKKAKR